MALNIVNILNKKMYTKKTLQNLEYIKQIVSNFCKRIRYQDDQIINSYSNNLLNNFCFYEKEQR